MISVTMQYEGTANKLTTWVEGPHAAAGIVLDALLKTDDASHVVTFVTVDTDPEQPRMSRG